MKHTNLPTKEKTKKELDFFEDLNKYIETGKGTPLDKFNNFAKYVPRQTMTDFLARYEIFKKILTIHGSIVECGVLLGGGLMTYAQLSSIFEPVHHLRKIIGFDTFTGFSEFTKKDSVSECEFAHKGGLATHAYDDIKRAIQLYDANRFLGHIPKVELVKGNAVNTIPKYLKKNPYTVISLLYLDMDIYAPTKVALKHFVPRMPKGAIIAFDELNTNMFAGETLALLETVGIRNLKIERFPFNSRISYAVLD